MSIKSLAILCGSTTLLCLLSIFLLDHPLASLVHSSELESTAFFVRGTQWLDLVTGRTLFANRNIDTLLLGTALTTIGIFFLFINKNNYTARTLTFIGTIELTTVLAASVIKNLFGRLRPYELFASGDWTHIWHAGGNSFPSGHVSFYWGLFLPLIYLFPRFRIPLFIIPIFIAFARIDENMHFLSDVLGAIALASFITLLAAIVLQRWIRPTSRKQPPKNSSWR